MIRSTMKSVNDLVRHLQEVLYSDMWLCFVWVGLGVATALTSPSADFLNVFGPVATGVAAAARRRFSSGPYFTLAFATAAERVLGYVDVGVWNPLFVWLLVGTYLIRARRSEV